MRWKRYSVCPVRENQGCLNRHRHFMTGHMVGYARASTNEQDLTTQRNGLTALGARSQGDEIAVKKRRHLRVNVTDRWVSEPVA